MLDDVWRFLGWFDWSAAPDIRAFHPRTSYSVELTLNPKTLNPKPLKPQTLNPKPLKPYNPITL